MAYRLTTQRNPLDPSTRHTVSLPVLPGLRVQDALPAWARASGVEIRVLLNGQETWIRDQFLADGDFLEVLEVPLGIAVAFAGVAASATGAALAANAATAAFFIGAAKLAQSFALSYLAGKLLAPNKGPSSPGDEQSPTYRFGGITSNEDAEGAALPLVYGQIRTGGVVVQRYTRASLLSTYLYTLVAIGEGPIEAIGDVTEDSGPLRLSDGNLPEGMEINGRPVGDFEDIEVHVRMGGLYQDPVPFFEASSVQYEVAQSLAESGDPGNIEIPPKDGGYDWGDIGDEAILDLWDNRISYSMGADEEADEFSATITFPEGLYSVSGTGSLNPNTAEFQIRYQELDGTGTPVGNVVVLPAEPTVSLAKAGAFDVEFRHPFIDPATYTAPVAGYYLKLQGVNGYAKKANPNGMTDPPAEKVQWTVMAWVRPDVDSAFADQTYHVCNFWDGSTNRGFKVWLTWDFNNPERLTVFCQYGTGSSTGTASWFAVYFAGPTNQNPTILPQIEKWNHVAVSYDGSGGGVSGAGRLKLYWNGTLLKSFKVENTQHKLPVGGTFRVGAETDSTNFADADFDVTKLFLRELSAAEIQVQYNNGQGLTGTGSEPDLLLAWPFDSSGGGESPDISPNNNDATLGGSASVSTSTDYGIAQGAGGGTFKRGRYKIEIQRLDAESSSTLAKNSAEWSAIQLVTWADFQYPGVALVGIRQKATDQLQGGAPTYTFEVKGRRVPVWDGGSTVYPVAPFAWSQNPAWIAAGILTDEAGLGDRYGLVDLKLQEFKEWADWCDEWVPDGLEQVDADAITSATLSYSSGTVTLVLVGVESPPDKWAVGYRVRLEGLDDEYDSLDGEAYEIATLTYVSSTDTLTLTMSLPDTMDAPTVSPVSATAGLVRGAERRMQCDIVLDRRNDEAVDVLSRVFSAGRAQRITEGGRVGVFVDKPASPTCLVTHASVLEGSLETTYVSIDERPNVIQAEILDRDAGYTVQRLELEHPDVQDPALFNGRRVRSIGLEGVVRRSQALREIKYQLNLFNLVRRQASWKLPALGIARRPGDVAMVAHDVPQWGFSGKLRGSTQTQALVQTATVQREVGCNVGFIKDYSVNCAIYRANLLHGARYWISETASGSKNLTDNGQAKLLDADAIPTGLTAGQRLATVLFRDVLTSGVDSGPLPVYRSGNYIIEWTSGTAVPEVGYDAASLTQLSARRYRFTVATPSTAGIHFAFTSISSKPNGLRIYHEDDEDYIATDPWDPAFVAFMTPFKWLRWMESNDINQFEGTSTIPAGYLFWTVQGPPPEAMADFSNRYGKDLWACCPCSYTPAAQREFASRLNDALAPERTLYLEWGNETWNAGVYTLDGGTNWLLGSLYPNYVVFSIANDFQPNGSGGWTIGPGALDPNPYQAMYLQMGISANDFFTEVNAAIGATNPRVVRVYGAQYANTSTVSVSVPECPLCDAVAGAPYNPSTPLDIDPGATDVDGIFTAMDAEKTTIEGYLTAFVAAVEAENKEVMWYEAGQQLTAPSGGLTTMMAAQADPRMKDQILWLLEAIEAEAPGSKVTYYTDATAGGTEGQFGAKRYHAQPNSEAPKYQALLEWIGDTGTGTGGGGGPSGDEVDYTLFLDRDVTIGSGTWYIVIQDSSTGDHATLTIQSTAGTYVAGDPIVARGTQGWLPAKGDEYSVGQVGKIYKQFRIVESKLTEAPLAVDVEAVEYNASIYEDDFGSLPLPETSLTVKQVAAATVPEGVQGLKASEVTAQSEDGTTVMSTVVEWAFDEETVGAVARVELYAQGIGETPVLRATLAGQPTSHVLRLDDVDTTGVVEIIARPVGAQGQARALAAAARAFVRPLGLVPTPDAPSILQRSQSAMRAVYQITHPEPTRVKEFELRSGGWLAGQRLGRGTQDVGPTYFLGPFSDDADTNGPIEIHCRAVLGSGQYGDVVTLSSFATAPGRVLFERWIQDQGSTGWDGVTMTGFSRVTSAAGTALESDTSTGTLSIEFSTPQLRESQEVVLHVYWEAEQTYADVEVGDGTPLGDRWTTEGPLWVYDGEDTNVAPRILASYSTTSSAPGSPSSAYVPGPVQMRQAKIKIAFTRADAADVGVLLKRVYIAAVAVPDARIDAARINALLPLTYAHG